MLDINQIYHRAYDYYEEKTKTKYTQDERELVLDLLSSMAGLINVSRPVLNRFEQCVVILWCYDDIDLFDKDTIKSSQLRQLYDEVYADFTTP